MTRSFLKQQLSVRTGSTISQIESGVFSGNIKRDPHIKTTSLIGTKYEDYFAKSADNHQVTKPYNIERKGWGLDVQRLDGTKLSIHVECCEVSIFLTYCHDNLYIYSQLNCCNPLN